MQRISEILKTLAKKANRKILLLAGAGILLLLAGSFVSPSSGGEKKEEKKEINMEEVRRKKETELEKFLDKIDGVSECSVMIAYRDGGSRKYGKNIKNSSAQGGGSFDEQIVMMRSGGEEYPVEEREEMPEIKGVTVIAAGGGEIAPTVARAVKSALGVEIHKIEVIINEKR